MTVARRTSKRKTTKTKLPADDKEPPHWRSVRPGSESPIFGPTDATYDFRSGDRTHTARIAMIPQHKNFPCIPRDPDGLAFRLLSVFPEYLLHWQCQRDCAHRHSECPPPERDHCAVRQTCEHYQPATYVAEVHSCVAAQEYLDEYEEPDSNDHSAYAAYQDALEVVRRGRELAGMMQDPSFPHSRDQLAIIMENTWWLGFRAARLPARPAEPRAGASDKGGKGKQKAAAEARSKDDQAILAYAEKVRTEYPNLGRGAFYDKVAEIEIPSSKRGVKPARVRTLLNQYRPDLIPPDGRRRRRPA